MDVRSINKLFPKIVNLEHFPLKVLLNIFEQLDYMDLYNLSEYSARFEGIAKIILNDRYSREYFVVDDTKHKRKTYISFFDRFGNEIKAINAKNIKMNEPYPGYLQETPWITRLLDRTKNLEKLMLQKLYVEFLFWHVNENLTHLTFCDCYIQPHDGLPKFRNLKKLAVIDGALLTFESLTVIVHNNPSLERLILSDSLYNRRTDVNSRYPFNRLMELVAANLNGLKEFGYVPRSRHLFHFPQQISTDPPAEHVIDGFFRSIRHLESLALSSNVDVFMDLTELMHRVLVECKSIKHLKLYDIDADDMEMFHIIQSFEKIESLAIACNDFGNEIYVTVEHLPFLRDLDIALRVLEDIDWTFALELLRKCPTLERLTVAGDAGDGKIEMFGTDRFYTQFMDTVQSRNIHLTVKFRDQIIGRISRHEVTWRNKLMRWTGCNENSSNFNLLDLVKEPTNAAAKAEQSNLFDLVIGYLDLNSLYSLSKANDKCAQLVKNYVEQNSQRNGTFVITDEFSSDYTGIFMFAEYVTNLRVNILYENIEDFAYLQYFLEGFDNITNMHIHTETDVTPHLLIASQVRHLIFDGPGFRYYSQLHELSAVCPGLETLELKQRFNGHLDETDKEPLEFQHLKRFTLKYFKDIDHQVENLKTIFKDTKTKLCLNI